ncbi:MAG: OB-fold domain-containing protein [Deltaproteobacteria bacterium]|nr:OB-fold domain-containing protein [Deltaproteobacteria bacterium]
MATTSAEGITVDCCRGCGKRFVPPAYVCCECGGEAFVPDRIPGEGTIYTHTVIRVAPEAFQNEVPYPMAVVELPLGLRMTARMHLEEGQEMRIGQEVRCVAKKDSGYWFALK